MKSMIQSPGLKLANRNDKPIIKNILIDSFRHDPHIMWLIEQSPKQNKLELIMDYLIEDAFEEGEIYLTNDNMAVALWKTEKKSALTIGGLKRDFSFLWNMGLDCVIRNLNNKTNTAKQFPKNQAFYYLYSIAVSPEAQGRGLASRLMNPMLEECAVRNLPVFLETGNAMNVEIYKKKGFVLTERIDQGSLSVYYMKYFPN
ncbi:GNAT family N-acetyltransferase [Aureibacter tunicatorum]|uniref:Ribosomal protein S18 acetylase RimI-like enzyme n=1 Tax=Aureibacter tunicatorum TaxID=866807 RepID=A0AAE3XM17_9BACT|nr:GNAT family N-acetyltransferase [Aureibacter tunicatorum]MDR6240396.1 ribosomal protein S18 acetylase RimI-like enzyme [Aureibacter tunicatorum]BDD05724.1 hypothetical protein AUTU_32070 [Aureibacter tunicatorum]